MKKLALLITLLGMMPLTYAQRASYIEQISLEPNQFIELELLQDNYTELYKLPETRIANRYASRIAATLGEDTPEQRDQMFAMLQSSLIGGYHTFPEDIVAELYFGNRGRMKMFVTNSTIRQMLFEQGCRVLCDLVALYPKDYKTRVLNRISLIVNSFKEFQMPQEELILRREEYDGSYHLYDSTGTEYEDFWLRRIYLDKIPYEELQAMIETLQARVEAVNVTDNDDMMACYKINNHLAYCQGTDKCWFMPYATDTAAVPLYVGGWNTPYLSVRTDGVFQLTADKDYPSSYTFSGKYGKDEFRCTRILLNSDGYVHSFEGTYYPHPTK